MLYSFIFKTETRVILFFKIQQHFPFILFLKQKLNSVILFNNNINIGI